MGRFHGLLPPALALATVMEHVDLSRLASLYAAARLVDAPDELAARLMRVVEG